MIVCEKASITYTAVPKNACTSLKCFFFHVNTGRDFAEVSPKKHLGYQGVHHVDGYRMGRFKKEAYEKYADYEHAAVIRDPVDRIRSAYKNRLFQYNDIRSNPEVAAQIKELGLSDQPGFGQLVDRLEDYLRLSNVLRFHMRPASIYLGNDLGFYSHVFSISETDAFCDLVRKRAKTNVPKVRANVSETHGKPDYSLTRAQYEKLLKFTATDYELMKGIYTPRAYDDLEWAALGAGL